MTTRMPKADDLKAMTDEELAAKAAGVETTEFLRTIYLREITRRERVAERTYEIEGGLDRSNEETFKIGVLRRTVKKVVIEFAEGTSSGGQAAWQIAQAVGLKFKFGEKILEAGYEYHLCTGIELRDGVQAADQRRNLIDEKARKLWKLVTDGTIAEIEHFRDNDTMFDPPKPPKAEKVKKERVKKEKACDLPFIVVIEEEEEETA